MRTDAEVLADDFGALYVARSVMPPGLAPRASRVAAGAQRGTVKRAVAGPTRLPSASSAVIVRR
jgi:hypothetical protein